MTVEDLLKVIKNPLDNPSNLRALASKLKRNVNEDDLNPLLKQMVSRARLELPSQGRVLRLK